MRRHGSRRVAAVAVMAAALLAGTASGEELRVEASVDRSRIGLDDELRLTVTIRGEGAGGAGEPRLPALEGFRLGGRSTSTSVQWINGRMSATRSFLYRLVPREEGRFVIGPILVEANGKTVRTEPIEVEVVAGSVAPSGRSGPGGSAGPDGAPDEEPGAVFVEALLSRDEAYVGQQVVLTYRLFTQRPILGLQVDELPRLTGFWAEDVELPSEPRWEETERGGERFFYVDVKKTILFPTRPGSFEIGPAVFSMAVRTAGDPFGSFFLRASEPVRRRTRPVTLRVRPLPEAGRPASFSGAVGRFRLEARLDAERGVEGEARTVTVALSGRGNLKTVDAPRLPPVAGVRLYDPKAEESYRTGADGLSGERRWEYVLVPARPGRHRIGPVRFAYFDPERGAYEELVAGPLVLDVAPAAATADRGAPVAGPGEVRLGGDIRYLKDAPERLGAPRRPYYRSGLFAASLVLPFVWNAALVWARRRRERAALDGSTLRRRRAHRMARRRLAEASRLVRRGSKEAYEAIAAALYRYAGDKLGASPSGLTTARLDALLAERGVGESMRRLYCAAIDEADAARFTPGERAREEMEASLERARRAIVSLDRELS